jgi:hypothetical protein
MVHLFHDAKLYSTGLLCKGERMKKRGSSRALTLSPQSNWDPHFLYVAMANPVWHFIHEKSEV